MLDFYGAVIGRQTAHDAPDLVVLRSGVRTLRAAARGDRERQANRQSSSQQIRRPHFSAKREMRSNATKNPVRN